MKEVCVLKNRKALKADPGARGKSKVKFVRAKLG